MFNSRTARLSRTDWGFLFIVLALVIIGLVMVYSASYGFSLMEGGMYEGQPTYFFKRQAAFVLIGLVALLALWRVDYHLYRKFAVHILVLTLLILLVTPPSGRWLFGGAMARSVQPAELAKLGAMVYVAVWLAAKGEQIRDINLGLVPFALLLGTMAGLIIIQPDFSTAVILIVTATAMFFVAGADMKQLLIGFLFGGVALVFVAMVMPYRSERILAFVRNPLNDPSDSGFQTVQALVALNKGRWLGVRLGQSQQKFAIYAPHTDGIFAIIGEELGFVGAAFVMFLYGLWIWRGLRIARNADDVYGMLLAVGIVTWVTFQAGLHVAVITASAPFTGTVLPFISYGGSSLTTCLASVGILLSISRGGGGKRSGGGSRRANGEPRQNMTKRGNSTA